MMKSGRAIFEAEFSEHVPKDFGDICHTLSYIVIHLPDFSTQVSQGTFFERRPPHLHSLKNSRNFRHRMGHKHTDELQEQLRQGELRPVCEDRKRVIAGHSSSRSCVYFV